MRIPATRRALCDELSDEAGTEEVPLEVLGSDVVLRMNEEEAKYIVVYTVPFEGNYVYTFESLEEAKKFYQEEASNMVRFKEVYLCRIIKKVVWE